MVATTQHTNDNGGAEECWLVGPFVILFKLVIRRLFMTVDKSDNSREQTMTMGWTCMKSKNWNHRHDPFFPWAKQRVSDRCERREEKTVKHPRTRSYIPCPMCSMLRAQTWGFLSYRKQIEGFAADFCCACKIWAWHSSRPPSKETTLSMMPAIIKYKVRFMATLHWIKRNGCPFTKRIPLRAIFFSKKFCK